MDKKLFILTKGAFSLYNEGPKEFCTMKGPRTEHVRIPNIRDRSNNNMVERLHGTIRQRNKVMRGLDDVETAQTIMDGMRLYCNFLRPHSALNGKTPEQKANIESDEAKWMALIKKASQHQRFQTSS
jgi:hypothetical protein